MSVKSNQSTNQLTEAAQRLVDKYAFPYSISQHTIGHNPNPCHFKTQNNVTVRASETEVDAWLSALVLVTKIDELIAQQNELDKYDKELLADLGAVSPPVEDRPVIDQPVDQPTAPPQPAKGGKSPLKKSN